MLMILFYFIKMNLYQKHLIYASQYIVCILRNNVLGVAILNTPHLGRMVNVRHSIHRMFWKSAG